MKKTVLTLVAVALLGAGIATYYVNRPTPEPQVTTAPVTRGDVVETVGATGTLQAVTTVQVGSQVSGTILSLGADFNDIVAKGHVIARLDPSLFQTQVEQARANLARAQADLERSRVSLDDATTKYARAQELSARNLLPKSDLDAAKVAVDAARAQLQSSQAQVVQSQAALNQSQVNLDHSIIAAPIDGIVTSRNVDVGQTVAASLQSPTLFVIAADLTKMQVTANVDEADVGRIRPGQRVGFRVDAYPSEQFTGEVAQVRLQPVVVQNVTTYGTVINVPNDQLKLKPGMTATVSIEIARRSNTLRIPNTALRFRPTAETFAAFNQPVPQDAQPGGRGGRGGAGGRNGGDATSANAGNAGAGQREGGTGGNAGGRAIGDEDAAGDPAARRARLADRMKDLTPDERTQMIERLKARGVDVAGIERPSGAAAAATGSAAAGRGSPRNQAGTKGAQTIDALFAPLQPTESVGRVWLYTGKQLTPASVRLGVTDGTNSELLSGDLQPGAELVTNVITTGASRAAPAPAAGNPLLPAGRGPGGFGGGGGGGRGR